MLNELKKKIRDKKAVVGIIGLGYVGLPLAVTFAKAGFKVYGIDIDKHRVDRLKEGETHILDVSIDDVKATMRSKKFVPTTDAAVIKEVDAVIICVPTPLNKTKEPDVSFIVSAVESIKKHMKRGQIIVLESTTYPGTTDEVMLPVLESGGMKEGKDFYLAFSPERVDPGNPHYKTENTPKIIGGLSGASTELAQALYSQVIEKVVPVSSAKVAEMVKLLENTFRIVNIGLVNEVMLMCDKLGIDVWEVIDAAKTKPYGFMPFYPGPGVGGHCLGRDEYIYVKDSDGSGMSTIRISDFVKRSMSEKDSRVHTFRGAAFIKPRGKEVFSYDVLKGEPCFRQISMLSERPYAGNMVSIKTADNRAFSVTDKHPVMVYRDGQLGVKFADELEIGDEIPVMLNMPRGTVRPEDMRIDLVDFLMREHLTSGVRVKGRGFAWHDYKRFILENSDRSHEARISDYLRDDYIPLDLFIAVERNAGWSVERSDVTLVTGRGPSFQSVPAVIDIDEDFMRFIGYYLSEGCVTVDKSIRLRLTFNSSETEYISDACLFLKEKGINYSIYRSRIFKSACIKVSSNIFGYLVRDLLGCGINSYTMKIPDRFMLLDAKLKTHLLMGILRGDGGVDHISGRRTYVKKGRAYSHRGNSAVVNYFTSSGVLFNQVVVLLQDLGFVPTFKKRKNLLNIFGYEQMKKMRDMFLGEKAARISSYIKQCRKVIPNKTFKRHKDFVTVRIKEITSGRADKVYSMEVAGTNTFVTSYGVLTHNCIPVDPIYLSWKARGHGFEARFIDLASHVNSQMPHYVVEKIAGGLNENRKALKGAKVLVLGVAYKKDVKDLRESPSIEIIQLLVKKGADVSYYDPLLPYLKMDGINLDSIKLSKQALKSADCVAVVTDHTDVDYDMVAKNAKLIVDTRNVFKGYEDRHNIVRL